MAEALFELAQLYRECGRGDMQTRCRPSKASLVRNRAEVTKVVIVESFHALILFNKTICFNN
jgi:hypothetical protein